MNKNLLRVLQNHSNLSKNRLKQICNLPNNNVDKAIEMTKISEKILNNGYDINPAIYKGKSYHDLRILNNSLIEFFQIGKTIVDEEMISQINIDNTNNNLIINNYTEASKAEKIVLLNNLCEKNENKLFNILKVENPEKKLELLNKYIDTEVFDEEDYLKKQDAVKTETILKELSLLESEKEKQCYLRKVKEMENKTNKDNYKALYNEQLNEILKDNKLSMDKQDFLKEAYFSKGLNIDEFKKNMGNEIYNCSEAQLENYVELWDKYQDNFISRDDFYYGKNAVFKEDISQESIEETLIPILEENSLSKKELDECINSSLDRDEDFFKEVTSLAITAKENDYSQEDIYTLIEEANNEPIEKIKEEIELIEDKPDDTIDVEKLKDISKDSISLVDEYDSPVLNKHF